MAFGKWSWVSLLVLILAGSARAECDRTFTMAHSSDYVPYQYQDELGRAAGLDIEVAQLVVGQMGCRLELLILPPKRAQKLLKQGLLDFMPAASVTPQRLEFAHFSKPYRQEQIVMFVLKEHASRLQQADLDAVLDQGLVITAGLGGWYGREWQQTKDRADQEGLLILTNSSRGRMQMLLKQRAGLAIFDRYVGYYHAKGFNQLDRVAVLPHLLNDDPAHFMFSLKSVSEQERESFDQALSQVLASEAYQQLLSNYRP